MSPMRLVNWVERKDVKVVVRTLALLCVGAYIIGGVTFVRQSHENALRSADRKSTETSQVSQCYQQVRNAPAVFALLGLIDDLATNSILSSEKALRIAPNDPLASIRRDTIRRLRPKRAAERAFITNARKRTPTVASCHKLATQFGVDDSKLKPKGAASS